MRGDKKYRHLYIFLGNSAVMIRFCLKCWVDELFWGLSVPFAWVSSNQRADSFDFGYFLNKDTKKNRKMKWEKKGPGNRSRLRRNADWLTLSSCCVKLEHIFLITVSWKNGCALVTWILLINDKACYQESLFRFVLINKQIREQN